MAKKTNINTDIFCVLKVSELSRVPVLIMSCPGMGKSTTVAKYAEIRGYHLELLRGNSTSENEVMGYDVADTTPGSNTTKHLRPSWYTRILNKKEEGKPTLLFLDEITTANEYVQAALLHLIFERMVGEEPIPEDTLIVSAGNYAQNLGNQFGLLPPLMNRFLIFNVVPEKSDLDTFLSHYSGAITGKMKDWNKELNAQFSKLDEQEVPMEPEFKNKVGEYIERSILETSKMLMSSGEKLLDLKVTDLQNIYGDATSGEDATLMGFVTFRTLNYLRDVAVASYQCFGKAGITSDNFRLMVDGLCGIALSRDKNGSVRVSHVGGDYTNAITLVTSDIEKMKNTKIDDYTKYFNEFISTKGKAALTDPELNALINKVKEMMDDKEIAEIDRPIDKDVISKFLDYIKPVTKMTSGIKLERGEKITDSLKPEVLMSWVVKWNRSMELISMLNSLVCNTAKNYPDILKNEMDTFVANIRTARYKLKTVMKMVQSEQPDIAGTIPEVKDIA